MSDQKKVKPWQVLLILLPVIAAILYMIVKWDRPKCNQTTVLGIVKSFGNAAADFSEANAGSVYWNDGETEFKDTDGKQLFNYRFVKSGYNHKYFSNSVETGLGKATKFVYLCYPTSCDAAKWAFYVDESSEIFEVPIEDKEMLAKFKGIRPNLNVPAGVNRFARYGLEFYRK